MTQNGAAASRSSRALTLQTTFPSKEHATGVERHLHLRHHRPHRSQQISSKETQSAVQPSVGNQLADLLSPSKIAVNNISHFGSKNASFSAAGSLRGTSRDPSRERGASERSPKVMSKEYSWDEINEERRRNQQREKYVNPRSSFQSVRNTKDQPRTLAANYASLATLVQNQSHDLNSLQNSLASTLASAGKLLVQLRDLYQSSIRSHETLTRTSIPHLTQTSETHLAALQRAHVSNSIAQLATLKARVARARERTTALQHRVETCAQRAVVEEERERADMRSHKRRMGLLWSLLAGLVIAWIGAAIWRSRNREGNDLDKVVSII